MNWGHKIIVVYAVFVAGMIFLVIKSSQQNKDLVTEDYYAKELVYQQKIDQSKRVDALTAPVAVQVINQELTILFPKDFAATEITGDAVLYCPADERKDKYQAFTLTDEQLSIPLPESYKGLFYVKLNWKADGVTYYYEKKIII